MNERIRELSNMAVLTASATYAKGPDAIWLKEYNAKFAELIVAECVNMINAEADKLDAVWWSEKAEENAVHGMRNAAGLISRAFITFK